MGSELVGSCSAWKGLGLSGFALVDWFLPKYQMVFPSVFGQENEYEHDQARFGNRQGRALPIQPQSDVRELRNGVRGTVSVGELHSHVGVDTRLRLLDHGMDHRPRRIVSRKIFRRRIPRLQAIKPPLGLILGDDLNGGWLSVAMNRGAESILPCLDGNIPELDFADPTSKTNVA